MRIMYVAVVLTLLTPNRQREMAAESAGTGGHHQNRDHSSDGSWTTSNGSAASSIFQGRPLPRTEIQNGPKEQHTPGKFSRLLLKTSVWRPQTDSFRDEHRQAFAEAGQKNISTHVRGVGKSYALHVNSRVFQRITPKPSIKEAGMTDHTVLLRKILQTREGNARETVQERQKQIFGTERKAVVLEGSQKVSLQNGFFEKLSLPNSWEDSSRPNENYLKLSPVKRSKRQDKNEEDDDYTGNGKDNDEGDKSLLEKPTDVTKVVLLVMITFPAGVLAGYLVMVFVFYQRHRRFLCCTSNCEEMTVKCLCIYDYPKTFRPMPNLSQLQVSRRHIMPTRTSVDSDILDLDSLVKAFDMDQRHFNKAGVDRRTGKTFKKFSTFRDDPSLTKAKWGKTRMQWWLENDRFRALGGVYSDPRGPEDDYKSSRTQKWSADFSSVSDTHGPASKAMPSYDIARRPPTNQDDEVSMASSASSYESETTNTNV